MGKSQERLQQLWVMPGDVAGKRERKIPSCSILTASGPGTEKTAKILYDIKVKDKKSRERSHSLSRNENLNETSDPRSSRANEPCFPRDLCLELE